MYDQNKPTTTGSPYFIITGLIVHSSKWKNSLKILKDFRKQLAKESYLPYDIEFHCTEMIDPHKIKIYGSISVPDRWKLIERYAETIGNNKAFSIICIVINKIESNLKPANYLTLAITKIYLAFDEFLKQEEEYGLVYFDRANEKNINTHVRKLLGTGASGETIPEAKIDNVIEDPIFRISNDSIFIQTSDVIAYTLKEKDFPLASRKKYQADRIFSRKLNAICFRSKIADDDGIIRA